jgi:hypothetical protein
MSKISICHLWWISCLLKVPLLYALGALDLGRKLQELCTKTLLAWMESLPNVINEEVKNLDRYRIIPAFDTEVVE